MILNFKTYIHLSIAENKIDKKALVLACEQLAVLYSEYCIQRKSYLGTRTTNNKTTSTPSTAKIASTSSSSLSLPHLRSIYFFPPDTLSGGLCPALWLVEVENTSGCLPAPASWDAPLVADGTSILLHHMSKGSTSCALQHAIADKLELVG